MQISPRFLRSDWRSRRGGAFPNAFAILIPLLSLCIILAVPSALAAQVAGPLTASNNPNYFKDTNGTVLILNGSQTWNTFQDWGANGTVEKLDFDAFVKFLTAHGHNFTLLWTIELPKFCGLPLFEGSTPDLTAAPFPWRRTGPGTATDGGLKFDLRKFDPSFFERLRARVQALNNAGIYTGVYLFTGEFLNVYRCSSDGYPFTGANNINGVDDGYTSGRKGKGSLTMTAPNTITAFQDAYVEKAIDALNDLPNVLWIVSEEAPQDSTWWNNRQIAHIRAYESRKPQQHPIGYAALEGPSDNILYNSDADWVAPGARISPNKSCGTGKPACKVNVNDSDHSYWEIWKDTPQQARNYAWENFMAGNQVLFMDPYLVYYPREKRNFCLSPVSDICRAPDPRWENLRDNLGYILKYSRRLNLANITPRSSLASTGYCLAQTPPIGAEYLVYSPSGGSFTVDLSAMPPLRTLAVEWFNPSTGTTVAEPPIPAGSASQSFTPPFNQDAVLYLVDKAEHAGSVRLQP
ncbi:MAG: putative collagen-binding domain-containing protein [Terriglobia bacterium]